MKTLLKILFKIITKIFPVLNPLKLIRDYKNPNETNVGKTYLIGKVLSFVFACVLVWLLVTNKIDQELFETLLTQINQK